ncbi:MAG: hypothetical protein QM779_04110 [Propionicimonas sp.]|uniref:hypothetical protein n=1 Tax=Propionicimonas sp. TaxID=1955623 RepID=UPI003D0D0408
MSHDAVRPPHLTAGLMGLRLRGSDYWYAVLYSDPPADEDPAYRHGGAHPLYAERSVLVADLGQDGIPIDEEMAGSVDVDRARAVVGSRMSREEIEVVINAWNALDDLTRALGVPMGFSGRRANRCYDKLFWGLNLASVTPPGQSYVPAWRRRELAKIDQVLRECGARVAPDAR